MTQRRPEWPMPTRPAPQPETEASSASSAAQPARQEPAGSAGPPPPQQPSALHNAERPEWPMPTRPATRPKAEASSASSAAQPARQKPADSALPPRHRRVNAVFGTDDPSMAPLQEVLEQIGTEFLFGKVANVVASSTGCYELATVPCIVDKLETFLEIVEEQRSRHLRRHPSLASDAVFSHEDMQEIHRAWMENHESWMNAETIRNYNWWLEGTGKGDRQKAHQLRRSAFSAALFQIIGNKHVVLASIQHPICSAAQPADAIRRFMRAWDEEKSSEDYKKRTQISERLTKERRALKNAAHAARQALVRGRKIGWWDSRSHPLGLQSAGRVVGPGQRSPRRLHLRQARPRSRGVRRCFRVEQGHADRRGKCGRENRAMRASLSAVLHSPCQFRLSHACAMQQSSV
ncbi:unnamed protein product [Prorocentrum cordatum]|uniref:Uncharacterized protein n=1 Tax=Prorocentrum cordatum TaxID=2364126 RepID=A0ABN9XB90_9DINO|nr:unnamed protein product [Polarella glacialis]